MKRVQQKTLGEDSTLSLWSLLKLYNVVSGRTCLTPYEACSEFDKPKRSDNGYLIPVGIDAFHFPNMVQLRFSWSTSLFDLDFDASMNTHDFQKLQHLKIGKLKRKHFFLFKTVFSLVIKELRFLNFLSLCKN